MGKLKQPEDTATFKFNNANPRGLRQGDCVVRAIATAAAITYEEALTACFEVALKNKYGITDTATYDKVLKELGFRKCPAPRKEDNTRYTGKQFCIELENTENSRNIFANIGGHHCVAIVDNKVNDIWNSTSKSIGNYWVKEN